MTSARQSDDDQVWTRLVRLFAAVEREVGKELQAESGLGLSDYRALCHLAGAESCELRIQELADRLGLDESSVSRLVARLERTGLVERDVCEADRRGIFTVLTEEGRRRWRAARPIYERALTAALDTAGGDPVVAALRTAARSVQT